MGLKLNEVTKTKAVGYLDGMPFSLTLEENVAKVEIDNGKAWRSVGPVDHIHPHGESTVGHIRSLAYHLISKFRNENRMVPA